MALRSLLAARSHVESRPKRLLPHIGRLAIPATHRQIDDPDLREGILTGAGDKAFRQDGA